MERLDKFLCDSGVGTRSQVKAILKAGRVAVDEKVERDCARKIDPDAQRVTLDGEILGGKRRVVVMLNKPAGYVTATEDKAEATVMELLPEELRRLDLKPVGRLDKATEGLLLLTNDGELLHRLISPKKEVPKIYYARHEGTATLPDIQAFAAGLTLRDGDRQYFYQQLDRHFPGMKERYIHAYGNAYELPSPNHPHLWQLLKSECKAAGIVCDAEQLFAYMHKYEDKTAGEQLSLF